MSIEEKIEFGNALIVNSYVPNGKKEQTNEAFKHII